MFHLRKILPYVATAVVSAGTAVEIVRRTDENPDKLREMEKDISRLKSGISDVSSRFALQSSLNSLNNVVTMHTSQLNRLEHKSIDVSDTLKNIKNSFK